MTIFGQLMTTFRTIFWLFLEDFWAFLKTYKSKVLTSLRHTLGICSWIFGTVCSQLTSVGRFQHFLHSYLTSFCDHCSVNIFGCCFGGCVFCHLQIRSHMHVVCEPEEACRSNFFRGKKREKNLGIVFSQIISDVISKR